MITLERARAKHLATIINLRQAVYDKYHDEYDPYMEVRSIFARNWLSALTVFTILSKMVRRLSAFCV